jgi:hypothetical protein
MQKIQIRWSLSINFIGGLQPSFKAAEIIEKLCRISG